MEDGYMKTWQECCNHFNVNPEHGLSIDQVKKMREKYGLNGERYLATYNELKRQVLRL